MYSARVDGFIQQHSQQVSFRRLFVNVDRAASIDVIRILHDDPMQDPSLACRHRQQDFFRSIIDQRDGRQVVKDLSAGIRDDEAHPNFTTE